jgi:TolA-binding protein
MKGICWRKGIKEAVEEISGGTRLLFLFFHRPECEGSRKTINEVFNDQSAIDMIEREAAPVMINAAESVDLAEKYRVDWTPAFVLADEKGNELDRWVGYLPVKDFMAQLTLSKGLAAFHLGRYHEAECEFEMLIDEYPDSELVPESEYFLGVAGFKENGETEKLARVCHTLIDKYPDSQWTKRCSVWSHMILESRRPFVGYDGGGGPGTY